jgi:SAM-dependent methyltransferase
VEYNAQRAAAFFDAYGEREWTRFHDGRTSPISLAVHIHYLRRFVRPWDRVLDAGAGPGRFTVELARLGAKVTVADVSQAQLDLNRRIVADAGLEANVSDWVQADILDLGAFDDDTFDATVGYGGPLSYVLDRADEALAELLRVTRTGGHLLLSVMSLVGATAGSLAGVMEIARAQGPEVAQRVIDSGDLPEELSGHAPMHMYRWSELRELLERHLCRIVVASASGLSYGRGHHELHSGLSAAERERLTAWEIELAAEPGAIDIGEHIIAVVQKTDEHGSRHLPGAATRDARPAPRRRGGRDPRPEWAPDIPENRTRTAAQAWNTGAGQAVGA